MPICNKCSNQFPSFIIIDGVRKTLHKRKYCLDCSPWNKHNTRKIEVNSLDVKLCPRCKTPKPVNEFYVRNNRTDPSPYCKECSRKECVDRQRQIKDKLVQYKGGKCKVCEYDRCNDGLEFHHIDSTLKDFAISSVKSLTNWDKIKSELDKCVLLCCRCHREVEAGLIPCPTDI